MIPTLADIIRMLCAGECSKDQALGWLAAHEDKREDKPKVSGLLDAPPPGCVCDPRSWDPGYRPICDHYEDDLSFGGCVHCEHDAGCHSSPPASAPQDK